MQLNIPSFIPSSNDLNVPQGATHFKITAAGLEMDFKGNTFNSDIKVSAMLPVDSTPTGDIQLECSVNPASPFPLLLVAGIEFLSETNGEVLALNNGAFTALKVLQAFRP